MATQPHTGRSVLADLREFWWGDVYPRWAQSVTGGKVVAPLALCTALATLATGLIALFVPSSSAPNRTWIDHDAALHAAAIASLVFGVMSVLWFVVSVPFAAARAWGDQRRAVELSRSDLAAARTEWATELAAKNAELAAERDRRPKLSPKILAAADRPEDQPHSWLIFLKVLVENSGADEVMLSGCEVRLMHDGQEHQGRPYVMPESRMDYTTHSNRIFSVTRDDLLQSAGPISGRGKIEGIVCSMFYDVPYEKFSDVVLGVRVRGIGCHWTEWTDFQPPQDASLN